MGKRKKKPEIVIALPEWISQEAWDGWLEMRDHIGEPPTQRAADLSVALLEKLRGQGHDANDVLNQSTMNNWRGLFAPRVDYRQPMRDVRVAPQTNGAMAAWLEVRDKAGSTTSITWSCPKIAPALHAIGGISRVRDVRVDQIHFVQRDFCDAYNAQTSNVVQMRRSNG